MRFEMLIVFYILIGIFKIIALHKFYTGFLGNKHYPISLYIFVYTVYLFMGLLFIFNINSLWFSSVATIASTVGIALILYSGNIFTKLITAGICITYHFMSEPLSAAIIMWVSGHIYPQLPEHDLFYFIGAGLSTCIYFLIMFTLSYKRVYKEANLRFRYQLFLFFMVVVCCFLAYSDMNFTFSSGLPMSLLRMSTIIAVGVISVFMYYVFIHFQENAENAMISYMLESQLNEMRRQFEIINSHDNEIRTLKHDLNNHLIVLKHIAEEEKYPELSDLAANLTGYIESATRMSVTGVSVVDTIIAIKKARAEQQKTEFNVIANEVQKIFINPIHLNIVIGNALDNALEACSRLPEHERRYIEIALKTNGNHLYMRVTNSSPPVKQCLNGLPVSSKRDGKQKGYGLESIRRMINEYNGMFRIDTTENEFILTLRMRNTT